MLFSRSAALLMGLALCVAGPAAAQLDNAVPTGTAEIVVTAQRTGAPVWQVTSGTTTLILIGSIERVTRDTRWRPEALALSLRGAERVMYPSALSIAASPLQAIGWYAKWRRQASLPKGQSLSDMLSNDQMARLLALRDRGLVRRDFERRHPLHLARELAEAVEAQLELGPGVTREVERAVQAHKLQTVPIAKRKAKPLVNDLFASSPEQHVPCLLAAVALAEAGPSAIAERSHHWAARRVPDALASPINRVEAACWPAGTAVEPTTEDIIATAKRLLNEREVTVAVVALRSLAGTDGVLEGLTSAGFEVAGPTWKR